MREWITELSKALFGNGSALLGEDLFRQTRSRDDLSYFPSHRVKALLGDAAMTYCRFAGLILAKALFEKVPVNVKLNPVVLKRLVGRTDQLRMDDLRDYDEQIYKSLLYLASEPMVDFAQMDLRFSVLDEEGFEVELIPGGKEVIVT